jgi:N-acetylmuramic acid 6-phosphate etherase
MLPDRGHLETEHPHEKSIDLDLLDPAEIVALMADDLGDVQRAIHDLQPTLGAFITTVIPRMADGGRLIYLGAGTSGRLGVLDASECPPTFCVDPGRVIGLIAGGDASLRRSSEGREDEATGSHDALDALNLGATDTVVGIAAGGTTPYVLGGLAYAASRETQTAIVTCAPSADLPDGITWPLVLHTGPELLTGSTRLKAATATKVVLNAITTAVFVSLGKTWGNVMVDLHASNDKLLDRAIRVLTHALSCDRTEAENLLSQCDGEVKTALVVAGRQLDPVAARAAIAQAGGSLRTLLGQPPS